MTTRISADLSTAQRITALRDNPTKKAAFARIATREDFDEIVAMYRVYLDTALGETAPVYECSHWAISVDPKTTYGRLGAISMASMEVMVLHDWADKVLDDELAVDEDDETDGEWSDELAVNDLVMPDGWIDIVVPDEPLTGPHWFFVLTWTSATSPYSLQRDFPGVFVDESDYRDGGPRQYRVVGQGAQQLTDVLVDDRVHSGVQMMARHLLERQTMQWRGHNPLMAGAVLAR